MSFKFNPITSQLDLVGSNSSGSPTAIDLTFTASETISALKAVYAVDATNVGVVDSTDLSKSQVLGVAVTAATTGQPVTVRIFGVLEDVSFAFASGSELFANALGTIVSTAVGIGFHLEIGHSIGTGKIMVQVRRPITL